MNKKMIVFIVESYFNKRDFSRFGVDIMKSRGHTVEVWDISQINQANKNKVKIFDEHFIFESKDDFFAKSSALTQETFVIPMLALDFRNFYIWRVISLKLSKLVFVKLGTVPGLAITTKWERLKFLLENTIRKPIYFSDMLIHKIARMFLGIRDFDIYLIAGNKSKPAKAQETNTIWATAMDYRLFSESPDQGIQNHIVFLDEYEPFHPDFKKYSLVTVKTEPYYSELNQFFTYLEEKYKLPVVIAAHPHVEDLNSYKKFFNDRKIIMGETISLIRDSRYVVAHTSTALQMAMLYKKPLSILSTDEMLVTYKGRIFPSYEIPYGFKAFNISNPKNFKSFEFEVNETGREKYLNDFTISKDTPRKIAWDIFCDKIEPL